MEKGEVIIKVLKEMDQIPYGATIDLTLLIRNDLKYPFYEEVISEMLQDNYIVSKGHNMYQLTFEGKSAAQR
jgi:hypothetical protein